MRNQFTSVHFLKIVRSAVLNSQKRLILFLDRKLFFPRYFQTLFRKEKALCHIFLNWSLFSDLNQCFSTGHAVHQCAYRAIQ